jgi:hypothetical protein
LASNKQLQEAGKDIEDGQYVVKSLYGTKFPFPEDEIGGKACENCIAVPVFQFSMRRSDRLFEALIGRT